MAKLVALSVLLLICQVVYAALGNADAAFQTFQGWQGNWSIHSNGKILPIAMTYEIGSKSSIVTERFGKELSVIYKDGETLLMTHFCNGGNQPRLRLKESSQPKLLQFEMFDITNLTSPGAAHVQRIVYKIIDDKTIDLEIVWQEGRSQESEKYTLTRN